MFISTRTATKVMLASIESLTSHRYSRVNMAVCCCEKIIHSELLCYLQNFFNQSPRENIVTAIVGFYNASEIAAAKVILMEYK